jgi:hypothetical protein
LHQRNQETTAVITTLFTRWPICGDVGLVIYDRREHNFGPFIRGRALRHWRNPRGTSRWEKHQAAVRKVAIPSLLSALVGLVHCRCSLLRYLLYDPLSTFQIQR